MPLQRRLPKRGFNNIFKKQYGIVNVSDLDRFEAGTKVDGETLKKAGLVAAKARWARIMALEISRRVNLKTDEIKAADLSTPEAIDGLLPSLSDFESDLRLAIAEMQVKARIAYVTAKLLLLNPEKDAPECWTASGKPAVDKLSELVGFEVTAAQRDAVWEIEGK